MTSDQQPPMESGDPEFAVPPRPELAAEDPLQGAIDRQLSEQRALRETLGELRDLVKATAARPADGTGSRAQAALQKSVDAMAAELKELRKAMPVGAEKAAGAGVVTLRDEMEAMQAGLSAVSADLEGIAKALIDLNSGLRDWAEGLDETIEDLRDGVARVGEAAAEVLDRSAARESEEGPLEGRVEAVEFSMKESSELIKYLSDQVEDLDRLMASIGELPGKLEGAVATSLRRAMATRAKLDKDAETALEDVLVELEDSVAQLDEASGRFASGEENVRKATLDQIDVSSRIESLQGEVMERLEVLEEQQRRRDEAIAAAIDAVAQGRTPRAKEALAKPKRRGASTKKTSKTSSRKTTGPKTSRRSGESR